MGSTHASAALTAFSAALATLIVIFATPVLKSMSIDTATYDVVKLALTTVLAGIVPYMVALLNAIIKRMGGTPPDTQEGEGNGRT
jgi:hypothetical protein